MFGSEPGLVVWLFMLTVWAIARDVNAVNRRNAIRREVRQLGRAAQIEAENTGKLIEIVKGLGSRVDRAETRKDASLVLRDTLSTGLDRSRKAVIVGGKERGPATAIVNLDQAEGMRAPDRCGSVFERAGYFHYGLCWLDKGHEADHYGRLFRTKAEAEADRGAA